MPRSALVRNHIKNRPVSELSRHAYFLVMPPNSSGRFCDESMLSGIDASRRHEPISNDSLGPVYCKSWCVPAGLLKEALESLILHIKPHQRNSTEIIVAVLAHADPARKMFAWGETEISIAAVARWAGFSPSVKAILLLGCSTAIPTLLMPHRPGTVIIAVNRPVSYDQLWLFCQAYFHNYRQYSRQNETWNVSDKSRNAMNASCCFETRNKIVQYG